jgi:hypothetical protein
MPSGAQPRQQFSQEIKMQNRSNFPQSTNLIQNAVKNTGDKAPVSNSDTRVDGVHPHQPTESKEN